MKYRKITAVILAVATAICAAGCNGNDNSGTSSSGDVTSSGSGDSSMTSDNTTSGGNSGTAQAQFTFSQVAMGGGGFVSGVFATSEQGLYYARTDVGGAYRYNKDTQKWEAMSYDISEEDRGLLGIDGLAFGEKDPNKVYMLAGTEYFSNGKTCLLYSDDYGKTWNRTELTDMIKAHGNGMGRGNGERIAVDPKNSDIVYVGGRTGGIIKSTDGGKTFTALDMGTKTTTSNGNGICSILIDPKSGDDSACTTIYAAISRVKEDNLYKSTDGGATWTAVSDAPKGIMVQRMKYSGDGKIVITYANTEGPWNNNRTSGGVRILDMSNDSLTDISPAKKSFGDVVIDPSNPDRMVACTENIYVPQPNGQYGDEFYVTTDGGKNWTLLNDKMKMSSGGVEWITTASMHWCSSMAIDPNNTNKIMVVSGNGVFTCDNIWDESPEFYFFSKGIEETVPYDIISIPGGKLVSVIGDYDGFVQDSAEEYGMVHNSVAGGGDLGHVVLGLIPAEVLGGDRIIPDDDAVCLALLGAVIGSPDMQGVHGDIGNGVVSDHEGLGAGQLNGGAIGDAPCFSCNIRDGVAADGHGGLAVRRGIDAAHEAGNRVIRELNRFHAVGRNGLREERIILGSVALEFAVINRHVAGLPISTRAFR